MNKLLTLFVLLSFQINPSFGQDYKIKSIGKPFITNFPESGINFSLQNFSVAIGDHNRVYYVGAGGVSIFDGTNFIKLNTPNEAVLRCVVKVADGTIYVGGNNDFGYLDTNNKGELLVKSLRKHLADSLSTSFIFHEAFVIHDDVFFESLNTIVVVNSKTKQVKAIPKPENYKVIGVIQSKLYAHSTKGILVLDNEKWIESMSYKNKELINTNFMKIVESAGKFSLLITNKGFFDWTTHEKININANVTQFLSSTRLYNVTLLKDKFIALSTNIGLLLTDLKGNPYQVLDKEKGFTSSRVFDVQLDENDLLWVATNNGIYNVDIFSPFTVFDKKVGLENATSFIILFNQDIYFSTGSGVLKESLPNIKNPFHRVKFENILESVAWRTIPVGEELIALTSQGTYVITSKEVKLIKGTTDEIYWAGMKFRNSNEVLLGSNKGQLVHLVRKRNAWIVKKKFKSKFPSVHYMTQGEGKNIWLSERNFGIYRIEYDREKTEILNINKYNSQNGLPSDSRNYVYSYESKPIFGTRTGIFVYDKNKDSLILDSRFSNITGSVGVQKIREANDGSFYYYTLYNTLHLMKKEATSFIKTDFAPNKLAQKFERHIEVLDDRNILMGTTENVIHIDPTYQKPITSYNVNITRVSLNSNSDTTIYGGFGKTQSEVELGYMNNSLRFSFSAAFYEDINKNKYQWKLNDFDNTWSKWSSETQKDYTNIPHGDYSFQVRAKNVYDTESEIAFFDFTILPPWYHTWWAYLLYVIGFVVFMRVAFRLNSKRLERENKRLESIVSERTKTITSQKEQAEKDADTISQQHDKLLQMDELKSRFFLNISHELRTPLTLTMGTVDQTIKGKFGSLNDEQYANLKVSYRNSERLLKMVNNILDISKLEGGKIQLYASKSKPSEVLDKVLAFFSSKFFDKHIELKSDIRSAVELYIDRDKFETIFINLIANAFKFTPNRGEISLSILEDEKVVKFLVKDNGVGIPSGDIPFVFDRFYQSPHTKSGEGTGVGLALSKELIELHGATIEVESTKELGTTFTLTFLKGSQHLSPDQIVQIEPKTVFKPLDEKYPLTDNLLKKEESQLKPKAVEQAKDKQHILIVEDNYEMRKFLNQILSEDYQTSMVENGEEGIQFLKNTTVDLILTDYLMPVMDGFEMAAEIKKNEDLALIPMVFLTARAQEQDKIDVLNMGVDDYLFKPFNAEELKVRISNLLRAKQQRAEYWVEKSIDPRDIEWKEFPSKLKLDIDKYIQEHIKEEITTENLVDFTGQSKRSLFRKVKVNTGLSLMQYIKEYRLRKARALLENKEVLTVSEAAYAVGLTHMSHFTRNFKERFGKNPSDYLD